MTGHQGKIETRCPACGTRYRVPASGIGHRARCAGCGGSFRVAPAAFQPRPGDFRHPPTEDDILRWLNEGLDEDYQAARPKVISGSDPSRPEAHEDLPAGHPAPSSAEARVPFPNDVINSSATAGGSLRKTG